jgi:Lhr-like helicase
MQEEQLAIQFLNEIVLLSPTGTGKTLAASSIVLRTPILLLTGDYDIVVPSLIEL